MNKRIFGLAIIVLAFLLTACAAEAPTPTPTTTETPALLSTNSQVTYEPTFTITPTQTLWPTSTPYHTPTIMPSQTPRPTITLPPYPTPDISFGRKPESISPSDKWVAWRVDCKNTNIMHDACFQFIKTDGTQAWNFTNSDIVSEDERNIYGRVMNWSPDNKFAYIVTYPMDIDFYFDQPAHGIAKLSLVNGLITYIITPDYLSVENEDIEFPVFYSYAFSNNGQWLIYGEHNDQSIDFTLLDLASNDVQYFSVITKQNYYYDSITWSPNDKFILFGLNESDSDDTGFFSIFRITLNDLSIKRLFQREVVTLSYPEWISNSEVKYNYFDNGDRQNDLILNIETGEVTEVAD